MRLKLNALLIGLIFTSVFISCETAQQEESSDVNNEIPVITTSEEALAHFNQGLELFDIGSGQKAREHFNQALELDPAFTSAYIYRSFSSGSTEEFNEDTESALANMESASDGEKMLAEINQTFIDNNSAKRMELLLKMVEMYPESARAYTNLGGEYSALNENEKARVEYKKAVDINPDWVGGWNALGFSFLFSDPKDFAKAEEMFAQVVEMEPKEARAMVNLGDCYRAQNDLGKARDAYAKSIELDATDPVGYLKKGHANSFLGNLDEARQDYQNSRQYDEYKGFNLVFEAFTYLYEDNPDGSLEWLENQVANMADLGVEGSRLTQSKMACINTCAMIAMHSGKVDHIKELVSMRSEISDQISDDINSEEGRKNQKATMVYWEGIAAAMEGDYDAALAKAEENATMLETISNPRKLENHHFLLGFIDYKKDNYADAIMHFEQANITAVYTKYILAMANEKAGNSDRAMELLNEISDNNFNNVGYALVRNEVKSKLASM